MPIREETKTVYFDRENVGYNTKREAQLAEIAYAIQDVTTNSPEPISETLQHLIQSIPFEYYPLILEAMNQEEIALRRESLPEKIIEVWNKLDSRTGQTTVILDNIAKKLEEEGYILIKKK